MTEKQGAAERPSLFPNVFDYYRLQQYSANMIPAENPLSLVKRKLRGKTARFIVVGLWNTLFGWALFSVLWIFFGTLDNYIGLALIAHFIAVTQAYFLYANHVFSSEAVGLTMTAVEFAKFNLSYAGTLAFGIAALWTLVSKMGADPILGQAATTLVSAAVSYFMHDKFSFSKKNNREGTAP